MSAHVVVLVHGWPVTDYHWRYLQPGLEAAGVPAISWSPPGLGQPAREGTVFTKQAIAAELGRWLHDRSLGRVVLIGHDWGGTIVWMLAGQRPDLVHRLVIEEETLPGVDVAIPEPGNRFYPAWHGPFNRAEGLAEALVPGREDAYFGQFLAESAGPAGLEPAAISHYLASYRPAAALGPTLAYYRTRAADTAAVEGLKNVDRAIPTLAIGGRFAMGHAVAAGLRSVGDQDVQEVILDLSGHYPAEQEPAAFTESVLDFIGHRNPQQARAR